MSLIRKPTAPPLIVAHPVRDHEEDLNFIKSKLMELHRVMRGHDNVISQNRGRLEQILNTLPKELRKLDARLSRLENESKESKELKNGLVKEVADLRSMIRNAYENLNQKINQGKKKKKRRWNF